MEHILDSCRFMIFSEAFFWFSQLSAARCHFPVFQMLFRTKAPRQRWGSKLTFLIHQRNQVNTTNSCIHFHNIWKLICFLLMNNSGQMFLTIPKGRMFDMMICPLSTFEDAETPAPFFHCIIKNASSQSFLLLVQDLEGITEIKWQSKIIISKTSAIGFLVLRGIKKGRSYL